MKVIWKFPLAATDKQTIRIAAERKIRSVVVQDGAMVIYAEVDPESGDEDATVHIIATGGRVPEDTLYVGVCMFCHGAVAYHIYIDQGGAL